MYNLGNSEIYKAIRSYFSQPSHPVNLAVFRIVLFSLILIEANHDQLVWLSHVPNELIFSPDGFDWFPSYFKIDETWITIAYGIFIVTSIMSIFGLFTQYSIFITTVLAFYLFGIPNFFGKVNHDHHLVLFAAIMSVSRCADVWSIDAIIKSRKKEFIPKPSILYGLPIRIIWILIGVLYFFAGFWKIYDGGLEWIFTDNLKFHMYKIWYLTEWTPFFRIDQYPILIKISALLTVLFEVSFIFFLFFRKIRYVAIIGGLLFHSLTNIFLKISFYGLQICYVIFFDWTFLYNWYSRYILKNDLPSNSNSSIPIKQIPYAAVIVGSLLIVGNVYAGIGNNVNSWFFACYPTFQKVMRESSIPILSIQTAKDDGKFEEVHPDAMRKISGQYQYARFLSLTYKIIEAKDESKFRALWSQVKQSDPSLKDVIQVRIYQYVVSTIPEEKLNEPISQRVLFEYKDTENALSDTNPLDKE